MLDYLEQYGGPEEEIGDTYKIQEELAALTKGDYVEEWNVQLREIGVKV